ncbi:MAG: hypothetical protein H7145_01085 [Akkermansiaceae bacterium]|nr:hypothetical protein [Armatimonadota bacterium]
MNLAPLSPDTVDPDHPDRVRVDGYTVLPSVFDPALLARIGDDPEGQSPYPEIIGHPVLLSLVRAVLGGDPVIGWLGYNPGGVEATGQERVDPVHSDSPWLYPEAPLSLPPFGLAVTLPLRSDMNGRSGAPRLWTGGTHMAMSPVDVERMAERMHSVQPAVPLGGLLVRDLRTWHCYAPNRSDVPCPSLTLAYTRPWYRLTVVPPPRLTQQRLDSLTDDARKLLRYADSR